MTCQGISLGLVSIGCCCFSFLSLEVGFYLFFTRSVSEVTDFLCPEFSNFRIFFFTRNVAEVKDFLCPDFFYLVPNYRIIEYLSHGMSRRSRIFFVPRLVLGPTDQREVIAEFLSITRSVADGCGACSSCEWGLFVVVYRPIRGVCV